MSPVLISVSIPFSVACFANVPITSSASGSPTAVVDTTATGSYQLGWRDITLDQSYTWTGGNIAIIHCFDNTDTSLSSPVYAYPSIEYTYTSSVGYQASYGLSTGMGAANARCDSANGNTTTSSYSRPNVRFNQSGNAYPAYTYAWSNNATSEDLSNVTSGTYSVVVTDCDGCSAQASATVTVQQIYGCMDPTAWNYNSLANIDDSSCIAVALACIDTNAVNAVAFDSLSANTNSASLCCFVAGCTDALALNYNANACQDDGSCRFQSCVSFPLLETWEDSSYATNSWLVSPVKTWTNGDTTSSSQLVYGSNALNGNVSIEFTGGETPAGWVGYTTEAALFASSKDLSNFSFNNLYIHDIYPTPDLASNIHKGYGIKLETQSDTSIGLLNTISDVEVKNTTISRTGHYGFWIKSLGLVGIDSVKNNEIHVENCVFEYTGGSGFVPNKSKNILVQNCIFNHTGSSIDNRMWKRGSGMWTFDCKNVVAQHNKFMNAHGPMDSYGSHIDYGNENVVFQYNYSFNNEGGFAEILGDNINCGYRYNISVNDGYREDPNGVQWDKKGKIFWVSNYCGQNPIRCPSVGTFIYNNTVFVNDTLNPEIYIWPDVGDVHLYNNLVVVGQNGNVISTLIETDSNDLYISHNLFYDTSRIDLDNKLENNSVYADPLLLNSVYFGENDPAAYRIQNNSPAINSGFLINGSNDSTKYLEHNGGLDYFGNSVSHHLPSNIGAFNGSGPMQILAQKINDIKLFPSVSYDYVSISIKNYSGPINTEIYSLNGDFINSQNGKILSLKNFKSGTYLCLISYDSKYETIKIVKL